MRGIISAAAYLPYWRLQRSEIGEFHGGRAAKGERTVAAFDEDSTTMAVEAGRSALAAAGESVRADLSSIWFTTTSPTYLEKSNAAVAHGALRLPSRVGAFDAGASLRSTVSALRAALASDDPSLLVASDIRSGLPNGADEGAGGDGAAALVVGGEQVIAEYLGGASATREFLDRWKSPGDLATRQWEEKFGENNYKTLASEAWTDALKAVSLSADDVDLVVIATAHPRAARGVGKLLGRPVADTLAERVGNVGSAEPALLLTAALESAAPNATIALMALADGADVLVFRTTDAIAESAPTRPIATQLVAGNNSLPYAKYLAWRQVLSTQPPNRPEPARMSGTAAGRSGDWKYGFVGSRDRESGAVHLPPARVSFDGGNVDDMEQIAMADTGGTVVTATIDRLAYSPSPPVIFAVVDFDGGGRLPVEICDSTPEEVVPGTRVEMTFRRLNFADGIANYFWKARPVRYAGPADGSANDKENA